MSEAKGPGSGMTELRKNDIYEATAIGYTSEGLGIVRVDGRAVFVKDLIEGEIARIRIVKSGKTAVYGRVEELVSTSPERITPTCPAYGKCGGCALGHMTYGEELRLKRRRVDDALRRIGGLDLRVEDILGAEDPGGYRNKTIYTLGVENDRVVTGFYRARSHDLVPAPRCEIESEYAKRAAAALRDFMNEHHIPVFDPATGRGIRRIMCRYAFGTGEGQIVLVTGAGKLPMSEELVAALMESCPETVSIMRNVNADPGDTVLSQDFRLLWGRDYMEEELCSLRFHISPGAFFQVNREQAQRLYYKALEYANLKPTDTALDLYCGAGTITLCLARRCREAVGVEIVESAILNARENAARNGVENASFHCSDAPKYAEQLRSQGLRPDVVVVDPPRKGLSPETPGVIASMEPDRIVYVSCDPATLARDLKTFDTLGYRAVKACAVDMFPRTHHVESVVLMTKESRI